MTRLRGGDSRLHFRDEEPRLRGTVDTQLGGAGDGRPLSLSLSLSRSGTEPLTCSLSSEVCTVGSVSVSLGAEPAAPAEPGPGWCARESGQFLQGDVQGAQVNADWISGSP